MNAEGSYPISFGSGRGSNSSYGEESRGRPMRGRMVQAVETWLRMRSTAAKIGIAVMAAVLAVVILKVAVRNQGYLFIACEGIHAAGLLVLAYKLTTHKTCSGLSSKSQELTASFLVVRLMSGTMMAVDIHSILDFITLITTLWVIYMIRFNLKDTYSNSLDNFPLYYVVVPSLVVSMLIYPGSRDYYLVSVMWAFGVYVEAFSVLPQLLMIQNSKMIEPFTAHYVFAMGVSRFISFAYWIIQVYETGGRYLLLTGNGYFWFAAASAAELIQSFILADFCYYYIKSMVQGRLKIPT